MWQKSGRLLLLTLFVLPILLCQGCASIISKSSYPVSITSTPSNATITIWNKKQKEVYRGVTPTTVTLKAGAGYFSGEKYTVEFKKDGYPTRTAEIDRGVDGWYVGGNFLLGGLVGWLIVDPLTGAMWTLKDLHVDLTDTAASASFQDNRNLMIVSLDQVPDNLRSRMVRIN